MKCLPLQQCVPQSHLSEDGIVVQCENILPPAMRRLNRLHVRIEHTLTGGGLAAILGDDLTIGYLLRRCMVSPSKRVSEQPRPNFVTSRRLAVELKLAHINCVFSPCVSFPYLNCSSRKYAGADSDADSDADSAPPAGADSDADNAPHGIHVLERVPRFPKWRRLLRCPGPRSNPRTLKLICFIAFLI